MLTNYRRLSFSQRANTLPARTFHLKYLALIRKYPTTRVGPRYPAGQHDDSQHIRCHTNSPLHTLLY